ncbi:MAG: hypothetical protein HY934_04850 [Candidatus Firestonebacteria bacterium]|nr:hypothetical protein [Candidatus Firestonebacteria bacterium]
MKKLFFYVLIFLIINTSIFSKDQNNIDSLLKEGIELYENAKWEEAIKKFLFISSTIEKCTDPDKFYDVYFYSGLCYNLLGKELEAKQAFKQAIRIKPFKTLDTEVHSIEIIELYDKARKEIDDSNTALVFKSWWECIPDKKSSIAIEYQDYLREVVNENKNDKITANYRTELLKFECGFAKLFSVYLEAGGAGLALPLDYGKTSFAYGYGAKIIVLPLRKINLDMRWEYLNFENEKDVLSEQWKRKVKWKESRTGAAATFFSWLSVGFYDLKLNGDLNYSSSNSQVSGESYKLKVDNDFKKEYFVGIKINGKKYFIETDIRGAKKIDSFRAGLGWYF